MSNENTIYECSADNTKWYGSNQNPEVCPVCGAEGSIEVPQDFASTEAKAEEIADIEPVLEAAPVEDAPVISTVSDNSGTITSAPSAPYVTPEAVEAPIEASPSEDVATVQEITE